MSDRPNCESKLEYQELMAGRSPHKGQVVPAPKEPRETKVDPYQDPAFHQPPPVSPPVEEVRAPMSKVREHVSRLVKKLLK